MARAASFDTDLELRVGRAQGQEMRALQLDVSLAPTINTLRHPGWARAQRPGRVILTWEAGYRSRHRGQRSKSSPASTIRGNDIRQPQTVIWQDCIQEASREPSPF